MSHENYQKPEWSLDEWITVDEYNSYATTDPKFHQLVTDELNAKNAVIRPDTQVIYRYNKIEE